MEVSVLTMDRARCVLLVIDVQARLMPAIEGAEAAVANVRRLLDAATLLDVPALLTEQNPAGRGRTVPELAGVAVFEKMAFDGCRDGLLDRLPAGADLVVAGCEAHVCVLQTVLGLLEAGRRVFLVEDAVASRRAESKAVALARMGRHGAERVIAEMVVFEWVATAADPRFRDAVRLVK